MPKNPYEILKALEETGNLDVKLNDLITYLHLKNYISKDIQEILKNVIHFSDTIVREIMIPRTEMITVSDDIQRDDLIKVFDKYKFSRLPVYSGNIDNIIGIVYSKDLLSFSVFNNDLFNVKKVLKEPFFVPETKKIPSLLKEFKEKKVKIAVVVDEFGGVSGMVTLIDIVEEIIGDLEDEYNEEDTRKILNVEPDTFLVDAKTSIEDIEDELNLKIEDGPYDTIGGFIIKELGRMPEKGELIEIDGFKVTVNEIYEKGIKNLIIKKMADKNM
jgi:CBS domain containing-hemolysin-like protein